MYIYVCLYLYQYIYMYMYYQYCMLNGKTGGPGITRILRNIHCKIQWGG